MTKCGGVRRASKAVSCWPCSSTPLSPNKGRPIKGLVPFAGRKDAKPRSGRFFLRIASVNDNTAQALLRSHPWQTGKVRA